LEGKVRGAEKLYEILRTLKNSGLFSSVNVLKLIDEEVVRFFKIKAGVLDGSILFITEMHTESNQKYSYHWQEPDNDLIMRWDNKPHWKDLKTFPHHKHIGSTIQPCHRVTLEEVLAEIKQRLEHRRYLIVKEKQEND
jgi:hypothetical protein